jgi:hypothetical protein
MTLSISRICSTDDRTVNECGAVGGMRLGMVNSFYTLTEYFNYKC